jgi:hypothetical protein
MSGHDQVVLEALERRYDGPVPEPIRRALRAGSLRQAERIQAAAETRFLAAAIRQQVAAIRATRRRGRDDAPLCHDLVTYRRAWRRWRAVERALS